MGARAVAGKNSNVIIIVYTLLPTQRLCIRTYRSCALVIPSHRIKYINKRAILLLLLFNVSAYVRYAVLAICACFFLLLSIAQLLCIAVNKY